MKRRKLAKQWFRKHRREIFALTATVLFFLVAEAAARAFNLVGRPDRDAPGVSPNLETSIIDDPQLFWRFKPNQEMEGDGRYYHINSISLRDHEIAVPKPKGLYRILSLGESTSFGAGVADNETYAKVVERMLRERFPERQWEVVNAGVGAYSSFQCVKYLELYGLALQPDMVWLFSGANDGLASYVRNYANLKDGFGYTDKELYEVRNRFAGLLRLLNHSDLYKLFKQLQTGRLLESYGRNVAGREKQLKQQRVWRPRVPVDDRRENLARYADLARARRVVPILLLPAYWTSPAHPEDVMREVAREKKALLIDLPAALHASGQFKSCWFAMDEVGGHPNAVGHRLMAETIAAALFPYFAAQSASN